MISLSEPNIKGRELKYIKECIDTEWVSSLGKYTNLFEKNIIKFTGTKYAVACINGTSALQVSLRIVGVQAGDEVIIPTITFIAPVNAIYYNGARPIFIDVDDFHNIDIDKTINFIEKETNFKNGNTYNKTTGKLIRAIVPVHMWGNAVLLDKLVTLCKRRNISIVEDASESLGTRYSKGTFLGKHTGTIGQIGCLSFNGNKIITSGGGGMILTKNKFFAKKARYFTTQAKDDPINYIHNEVGYNFRLNNVLAAIGVAQLEQLPKFLKRKKQIHKLYLEGIKKIKGLSITKSPDYAENNHWLNILKIDRKFYSYDKDALIKKLKKNNIESRPIWYPNHLQKPYRNCQSYKIEKANKLLKTSLCMPSSTKITNKEIKFILGILKN